MNEEPQARHRSFIEMWSRFQMEQQAEKALSKAETDEQLRLKRRMQLKRMEIKIQKAADDNFGYDPSYDWYHKLLETRSALSGTVSRTDHDWWLVFEEYRYNENCKNLPVFI